MVKYSLNFKLKLVHEYLKGEEGYCSLARKYGLNERLLNQWVQLLQLQGPQALMNHRRKRSFTAGFKLAVLNYYQTHPVSMSQTAAKFKLLPAEISRWHKQFAQSGLAALKPQRKGRPPLVKQHRQKQRRLHKLTSNERLKEELVQTKQKLYQTRMECDLLKKSLSLFGPAEHGRKHS